MKYVYNINNFKLFGYHGIYDTEKKNGQYFLINLEYIIDYNNKDLNDSISEVIDYEILCDDIKEVFKKRCNLIETLILNIKLHLESKYNGIIFNISIMKESLLINHKIKSIEVKNIT